MNLNKDVLTEKRTYFGLALLLWAYLWVRAYFVPMAHDEIATFFYYVVTNKYIPYYSHWDANNHFINSLLSWVSFKFLGSSSLALRTPNLLTFPIFAWYLFKISGELSNKIFRWMFLITICTTHYFVEFFALCRGYGMSMAFMIASIWYLMLIFKNKDTLKNYVLSILFMILATSCNLTLINTLAILIGLLFINIIFKYKLFKKESLKRINLILFLGIIPLILTAKYIIDMKAHGNLYAGSLDGFVRVTIRTLIEMLTNYNSYTLAYISLLIIGVIGLLLIILFLKEPTLQFITNYKNLFFYLLIGNIIATVILGKMLKVNYPEDRLGIYFYPLFVGSVIFVTDQFYLRFKKKIFLVFISFLVFFPIHFISILNLTYTNCYKSDMMPQRFYDKVCKDYIPKKFPPTIGGDHSRHFCWSYLDYRNGGNLSQIYYNNPAFLTDYLIGSFKDKIIYKDCYDSIDYCIETKNYLFKIKYKATKILISEIKSNSIMNTKEEFYSLAEGKVDTLKGKTLYFGYKLTLESTTVPFYSWIVVTVLDKQGKQLRYEFIALNWLKGSWNGENDNFINGTFVYKLPPNADKYITYIWNINKVGYSLKEGKVEIYNTETNN